MSNNILYILIGLLSSAGLTAIAYFLFTRLKKGRYDKDNHKAILEEVRSAFEKQIYILNDRLVQNEERWRDVNHLLLRNEVQVQPELIRKRRIYYSDFLKTNGITENDLTIDDRLIFVLTPFHDLYYEDYNVVKDTCSNAGFKCYRGDEHYFTGDIFPEMLRFIVKARLIIANINGRNPNVLYELGIAQALDKQVILIAKKPEELPIDIKSKRFLIYTSYEQLRDSLRQELFNISNKHE
jgi:hypothetical protein